MNQMIQDIFSQTLAGLIVILISAMLPFLKKQFKSEFSVS